MTTTLNRVGTVLNSRTSIDIFETAIGWFGILYRGSVIRGIKFGFETSREANSSFENDGNLVEPTNGLESSSRFSANQRWRNVIREYAEGHQVSFSHLKTDLAGMTPFQKQVVRACRQMPYGSTMTYGELAAKAGSPGAARAVGTIMRTNRFPIVVPCHRVVGAGGLGGYSAGGGEATKRQLLTIENAIAAQPLFD